MGVYDQARDMLRRQNVTELEFCRHVFKKFCFLLNGDLFACVTHDPVRLRIRDLLGYLIVVDEYLSSEQVFSYEVLSMYLCRKGCDQQCRGFQLADGCFFHCDRSSNAHNAMLIKSSYLDKDLGVANIVECKWQDLLKIDTLELELANFKSIMPWHMFMFASVKRLNVVFTGNLTVSKEALTVLHTIREFQSQSNVKYVNLILRYNGAAVQLPSGYFKSVASIRIDHVTLAGNTIHRMGGGLFNDFAELFVLDLSCAGLTTLDDRAFKKLPSLKKLNLSGNKLTSLHYRQFSQLASLEILHLQMNPLVKLEPKLFRHLAQLYYLDLSDCGLESLDSRLFHDMPRLQRLFLQNNSIDAVCEDAFINCPELIHLDMSNNQLVGVRGDTFQNQRRLWCLSLARNRLASLEPNVFRHNLFMYVLDVSSNEQLLLSPTFFAKLPLLGYAGLAGLKQRPVFRDAHFKIF
jgi:hypothetical protein